MKQTIALCLALLIASSYAFIANNHPNTKYIAAKYNSENGEIQGVELNGPIFRPFPNDIIAIGVYLDSNYTASNFGILNIETNPEFDDNTQAYGKRFLFLNFHK